MKEVHYDILFTDEQMKAPRGKVTYPRSHSSSVVHGQDVDSDPEVTHLPMYSGRAWLRQNCVGLADSPRLASGVCCPQRVVQQMAGEPGASLSGTPPSCAPLSTHHLSEPQLLQLQNKDSNSHLKGL